MINHIKRELSCCFILENSADTEVFKVSALLWGGFIYIQQSSPYKDCFTIYILIDFQAQYSYAMSLFINLKGALSLFFPIQTSLNFLNRLLKYISIISSSPIQISIHIG